MLFETSIATLYYNLETNTKTLYLDRVPADQHLKKGFPNSETIIEVLTDALSQRRKRIEVRYGAKFNKRIFILTKTKEDVCSMALQDSDKTEVYSVLEYQVTTK